MYRILLLVVILIAYGTLYPFRFHEVDLPGGPLWVLLHSWPYGADRFLLRDVIVNVTLYMPLGMSGFLASSHAWRRWVRYAGPVVLGLALSGSLEMLQLFEFSRRGSIADVICNATGAALGVIVGIAFQGALRKRVAAVGPALGSAPSSALFLIACWIAYQIFPGVPYLGRTRLANQLHDFVSGPFSFVEALAALTGWLAAARLLETIAGVRHVNIALAAMLCLLPLRMLIPGRQLALAEVLGGGAAFFAWTRYLSLRPGRAARVAWLFLLFLVLQGLAPFQLVATSSQFVWHPFAGVLSAEWSAALVTLLKKIFWYGSTIWLFRAAGCRLAPVAACMAALLAAIEVLQRFLPGRTAEITDPLLALLVALVLWLLDRRN